MSNIELIYDEANNGNIEAQIQLANLYRNSFYNVEKYKFWMRVADPNYRPNIVQLYINFIAIILGKIILTPDIDLLLSYYEAAKTGNIYAQFNLGQLYKYSFNDMDKYNFWTKKAANSGHRKAQQCLHCDDIMRNFWCICM